MASKPDKEKKDSKKSAPEPKTNPGKTAAKPRKEGEVEEDEEEEDSENQPAPVKKTVKAGAKVKKEDEEDDDEFEDEVEEVDEWEKVEEEEEWDPDFDEFDLPKSRIKKATGTKKGAKGAEEEDLGLDDDFKDMDLFNDGGFDEEEEDF
jgi:DNA-directed RNA polymerase subunit delta